MESRELRIGNYIKSDDGIICCVECIESKTFTDWNSGNDYSLTAKEIGTKDNYLNCINDSWQPIELTEEILLKCGFEKSAWDNYSTFRNLFCSEGCMVISLENKYIEIGDLTLDIEIKYLHQLQNLYWCLCGKELEINL